MKTSTNIDLNEAKEFVLKLMPKAGKILMEYFTSKKYEIHQKEGNDFATDADLEVDKFITGNLKRKFPQSNFLTEETAPDDYSSLEKVENLWVIDPLDGTINFSRQNPIFAISVALCNHGIPQIGVVYLPVSKDLYWTTKIEKYAFHNNELIHVSKINTLPKTIIATDWSRKPVNNKRLLKWIGKTHSLTKQIKIMGSAVEELVMIADCKTDVYLHFGLKPWDMAAAGLIIQKAGGKVTQTDGSKWNIFKPGILATNGIIHEKIITLVNS
jgi:myo-inositol-1(or 4)-monophosphatase